ncbi:hypothetical protein Zmor_004101 [Zophobas morio]|uniref:Uncharacterized protein n=1 Tax=Zophobas morio TaxID=2755281 RepID=A0AA38HKZ1_9CUCU|nr:hypothetical protein Zmor_004101 [Zophobas morio]
MGVVRCMRPEKLYGGSRHPPLPWKILTVVVLPERPRPVSTPIKYRSISLLSAVDKVGEVAEFQFRFRQGHFTRQQLLRLTEWTTLAPSFLLSISVLLLMKTY